MQSLTRDRYLSKSTSSYDDNRGHKNRLPYAIQIIWRNYIPQTFGQTKSVSIISSPNVSGAHSMKSDLILNTHGQAKMHAAILETHIGMACNIVQE